jgi:hypothetical protein
LIESQFQTLEEPLPREAALWLDAEMALPQKLAAIAAAFPVRGYK